MLWQQLTFVVDRTQAEFMEELLFAQDAQAVTMKDGADEPLFEPPLGTTPVWNVTLVIGLFTEDHDMPQILQQIHTGWQANTLPEYQLQQLPDQVWERSWMDGFTPMRFGKRLWIVPSWLDTPDPAAINIQLDPGIAFGTGTHPTTRLCLEWLDQANLQGKTVIDFGSGSGILAIAAMKLGAAAAHCTDIDPQAVAATLANSVTNQIDPQRFTSELPPQFQQQQRGNVNLLLANILATPLIEMVQPLCQLVIANGTLVLSGILSHQADQVVTAYAPFCYNITVTELDGWARITMQTNQIVA